ncbi:MAG: VIT1/CCC1 transporter family protein [Candidatus Lokiarchaeota archaeon]
MGLKSRIKKWRAYSEMSNLGEISRRKFFNNCFDGTLTSAGIVSGMFMLFLSNPSRYTPIDVVVTGFATALAIGISGLWGAFLSEEAERNKKISDLKRNMAIYESSDDVIKLQDENNLLVDSNDQEDEEEIRLAMVTPIILNSQKFRDQPKKNLNGKKKKSVVEHAERFASIVAAIVDGGAPVIGSSLPLIPFFFGLNLSIIHFLFSYAILIGILVYLGIFLGNISGKGKLKYVFNLVLAGIITLLISLLLGQLTT